MPLFCCSWGAGEPPPPLTSHLEGTLPKCRAHHHTQLCGACGSGHGLQGGAQGHAEPAEDHTEASVPSQESSSPGPAPQPGLCPEYSPEINWFLYGKLTFPPRVACLGAGLHGRVVRVGGQSGRTGALRGPVLISEGSSHPLNSAPRNQTFWAFSPAPWSIGCWGLIS